MNSKCAEKPTVDDLIAHPPSLCVSGNNGTFSAVRFHTVTTWPIFSRLETIPLPMSPRPRNPILEDQNISTVELMKYGKDIVWFDIEIGNRNVNISLKCSSSKVRQ